ncbi:ankyrin repeat and IBR domain-containing protein 1-like [Lingula anatina]|uniref:RBR-type E3 ubiquitin transferase n=1 Tax=Lingula anatina TaxID=7574 RepID=A0A1S3JVU0_LINAN|nr:ankyrin repeat and IBR domain-containing protein 1-like [Lingula anatina]|eukprot:XP_013414520.1 ankyrin repeat and IBR domain-containing protein 1-like [Lingula anatina]
MGLLRKDKNTGLHYAASSGLKRCVEFLVNNGAPLFIENVDNETPCDCAERAGFSDIALYLESKMVFSNDMAVDENEDAAIVSIDLQEEYSGLKAQDLQEAKDQLLVETSDMLRVPLFTAEALLRNHEWSREMLLEAWMRDAIVCCEKSGVNPPSSVFEDLMAQSSEDSDTLRSVTPRHHGQSDILCDICANYIPSDETAVPMSCEHRFCRACWEGYLNVKIQEGEAHNITCPAYDCIKLVPVELIEEIVSRDMARRYLQFDIQAFVDSNPNIKWCPSPGCIRAVKLPDMDGASGVMSPVQPSIASKLPGDTSRSVDCGSGHYFCWDCLGEAHAPASCENWSKWFQKISEICPEALCDTSGAVETSANILWLVTNAKPCPNCKSPIQKNEGCNHMKCSKCKHDFCWVCLEQWKKHSSATGGYFRCNRYDVSKKVDEQTEVQKTEAEQKHMANKEMHKFVHYYTRFKNHDNSFKLEEPLLTTAKEKMLILANAVSDPATADIETKFIEDAVHQLLKARRVLKCSYVYGYYIEEVGIRKPIFEFMQTELEEATENLSQMINRPYLRTPRNKIIGQAQLVTRKRHDLIGAIARGLVPVDLSPGNSRKKYSFDVDFSQLEILLGNTALMWIEVRMRST